MNETRTSELSPSENHVTTSWWKLYWHIKPFGIWSGISLSVCGLSSTTYPSSGEKKNVSTNWYFFNLSPLLLFQSKIRWTTEGMVSYKTLHKNSSLKVTYGKTLENVLKRALDRWYFVYLEMIYIIHSLQWP